MKLPQWVQIEIERGLDLMKPGCIEIHTNGLGKYKVKKSFEYTEPPEARPGMPEYGT
jgi:hypothetical protein